MRCTRFRKMALCTVAIATIISTAFIPPAQAATDPPTTVASPELIQRVPDSHIMYNGVMRRIGAFAGLVTAGPDDAYAIKADQSGDEKTGWATLHHIDDFARPDASTETFTIHLKGTTARYSLGHANGLEYHRAPVRIAVPRDASTCPRSRRPDRTRSCS